MTMRWRRMAMTAALLLAGCAGTPQIVLTPEEQYEPETITVPPLTPLVEYPPIEPVEPPLPPLPTAAPAPAPASTAIPVPSALPSPAPAGRAPSEPLTEPPQEEAPAATVPPAAVTAPPVPAAEPSEDLQLIALLVDLQRYAGMSSDDLRRELANATAALARTRTDANRVRLAVLYTPGHTDDSYSYLLGDRVFTGDTLLIRGTGRTDFQNGDPRAQYDSIFNKLMKLPDETLVYPAHDYKGETVSTIGEEKSFNPRLKVKSIDEYVDLMNSLNLPNPKMMDVAVPANIHVGLRQEEIARKGWALSATEAMALRGAKEVAIVDLREKGEREKHGVIPGSLHAPYPDLVENISAGGMLHELAAATGKRIVFYCAYGERSAMAVQAAQDAGLKTACHIEGGIDAWKKVNGPLAR